VRVVTGESVMTKTLELVKRLGKDEQGAALIEYTVLLGVLLVAVISTIGLVGNWVSIKWTALACSLSNAGSC
jgi:pilus assembly protein Flp/PilA